MVSARWVTKEATGVSSDVWVHRRWLDVACSGVGGLLNGDKRKQYNRQEMRVRKYGKYRIKV